LAKGFIGSKRYHGVKKNALIGKGIFDGDILKKNTHSNQALLTTTAMALFRAYKFHHQTGNAHVCLWPVHFRNMSLSFSVADLSSAAIPTSLAECPASGTTCIQ